LSLADAAAGAPSLVVAQIAKIRAALLRDLLGTNRLVRAGSDAAPHPKAFELDIEEPAVRL
jgi:hypothetical protein